MSSHTDHDSSSDLPLLKELTMNCFALVPRRYYPSLSLVSKPFNSLTTSQYDQLYHARRLLQTTENVLYVALRLHLEQTLRWYVLNPKLFKNETTLVPIPSFPSLLHWGSSVVAIGYEIYVFGGCIDEKLTSNVFVFDCRTHTRCFLPSMRVARGMAATGVIDEKVYVIGGCKAQSEDWIEVFDLKTRTWESVSGACNEEVKERTIKSFVMGKKIYIMDEKHSFVYDPEEKTWEMEMELNKGWKVGSCVIDNMLYSFGEKNDVKVYDPNTKSWRVLKGVEDLPEIVSWSRLANYGGKLAVLINVGTSATWITCVEIELEWRKGGEIWGKILSSDLVFSTDSSSTIKQCLTITI